MSDEAFALLELLLVLALVMAALWIVDWDFRCLLVTCVITK